MAPDIGYRRHIPTIILSLLIGELLTGWGVAVKLNHIYNIFKVDLSFFILLSSIISILYLLILAIVIIISIIRLILRKKTVSLLKYPAIQIGCLFLLASINILAGNMIMERYFRRVVAQSTVFIDAIESYEKANGYPPKKLDLLSPDFMSKKQLDEYRYISAYMAPNITHDFANNEWILWIQIRDAGLYEYSFVYLPRHNYSEWRRNQTPELYKDWALFKESPNLDMR